LFGFSDASAFRFFDSNIPISVITYYTDEVEIECLYTLIQFRSMRGTFVSKKGLIDYTDFGCSRQEPDSAVGARSVPIYATSVSLKSPLGA
jgi:hypothetical protein